MYESKRGTGQTARCLLKAAHMMSEGKRVLLLGPSHQVAAMHRRKFIGLVEHLVGASDLEVLFMTNVVRWAPALGNMGSVTFSGDVDGLTVRGVYFDAVINDGCTEKYPLKAQAQETQENEAPRRRVLSSR